MCEGFPLHPLAVMTVTRFQSNDSALQHSLRSAITIQNEVLRLRLRSPEPPYQLQGLAHRIFYPAPP